MKYSKKVFMVASSLYAAGVLSGGFAYAGGLPSGGQVVDGGASISQSGDTLNIDQSTDKAVIDWNSFSVGKGNTVNFNQPASDSATLNRVTGNFTSEIAGQINANGSVFLVNPNGILITADGVIDTGNFVASTLDIDNNDFMKGDYTFTKSGQNGVVDNRGSIAVDDGGFVALLGGAVKSDGTVRAHVGKVGFAGGEKIVMSFGNNDFLRVEVPTDKWDKLTDSQGNKVLTTVDLGGTIESRGGFIDIAVADAADILRQSISISGVVSANTVSSTDGVISISGGSLGVLGNGRITADADYGNAGTINIDVDSIDGNGQFSAASQNGTGGTIKVSLQQGADLTDGTSFDVSGRTAGGTLSFIGGLSGKGGSKILGSIDFKADSTDGKGGYIDISNKGGLVGLFSGTISASGKTQGGRIRLGGAFQGGGYDPKTSQLDKKTQDLFVTRWSDNSSLVSANKTSLGTGVSVVVSSASGTGGTAILWADNTTNNYAAIDATGATGGGAVEISGKEKVDSFGLARVKAGNGVILLDPKDIVLGTTAAGSWGDSVSQVFKIGALSGSSGNFGHSVALSGNGGVIAIGDDNADNFKGAVYIYEVKSDSSGWGSNVVYGHTIKNGTKIGRGGFNSANANTTLALGDSDYFGSSVALNTDGTKLAVGARFGGEDDAGMVYLFGISKQLHSGIGAIRYARIQGSKGNAGGDILSMGIHEVNDENGDGNNVVDPRFGSSVALSGDGSRLAVGSNYDNSGGAGGAVYLFSLHKSGAGWGTMKGALKSAGDSSIGDDDVIYRQVDVSDLKGLAKHLKHFDNVHSFGYQLSFDESGDRLAVGDFYQDVGGSNRGAVYLFSVGYSNKRVPNVKYVAKTKTASSGVEIFGGSVNDGLFGSAIALNKDGTRLAVGAYGESSNKGAVYLYKISDWKKYNQYNDIGAAKITLAKKIDGSGSEKFGFAVALDNSGEKLVVGARKAATADKVRLIDLTPVPFRDDSADIEKRLNDGASVNVVASNDITVDVDIVAASGSGKLTLIAGKSIAVNQNIDIKGGLELRANDTGNTSAADANGDKVVAGDRDAGKAQITVAAGKKLESDGDLIITMLIGKSGLAADKKYTGKITVEKVKGSRVSIIHEGTADVKNDSEIVIRSGGQIEATKTPSASEVVLELKADKFTNLSDQNALSAGRYLVWTKTFDNNTMGGINGHSFVEFNKSYGSRWGGSVTGVGSGFIYSLNPAQLKVTANVKTKVYDGTPNARANNLKVAANGGLNFAVGSVPSSGNDKHKKFYLTNTGSLAGKFYKTGTTSFVPANEQEDVGTGLTLRYNIPSMALKDGNGKTVHGLSVTYQDVTDASITKKELIFDRGSLRWVAKKTYDGDDDITVSGSAGFSGEVRGDDVRLAGDLTNAFKFHSKNAHINKYLKVKDSSAFALSGAKAGNYKLVFTAKGAEVANGADVYSMSGTIDPKELTLESSHFNFSGKIYDGNTDVSVSLIGQNRGVSGFIGGDDVKVKVDSSDPKERPFAFNAADVKYGSDGTTVVGQDIKYNSSKVSLQGNHFANYKLSDSGVSGLKANITPRTLVLAGVELKADEKVYDGTDSALVTLKPGEDGFRYTGASGEGIVSGDDVKLKLTNGKVGGSQAFKYVNKNAEDDKKVQVGTASAIELDGAKKGNYVLKMQVGNNFVGLGAAAPTSDQISNGVAIDPSGKEVLRLVGDITKRKLYLNLAELHVKGAAIDGEQVYDGDTEADVKLKTASREDGFYGKDGAEGNVMSGDSVNLTVVAGAFKYDNANVNPNGDRKKDVKFDDVNKITLTGQQGGNYELFIKNGDITSLNGADKKVSEITGNIDSTIDGKITQRPLTVSATPINRPYDGTRVIALTNPTLSGWVSSDTLLKTYAAAIDSGTISGSVVNGNAASAGKSVTITGNSLTLKSAYSNYSLAYDNTQTVVISKRPLTVSATPTARTYDGTRVIALTNPTLSGWVSSDTLPKTYAAAIDSGTISGSVVNGNAASAGKTVTITGNSLTLKSAYSNYSLAYDNTQTVVISKRPLTVSATPTVRTYDGTRVIALTNPTLSGWVSSDTLLKTYAAAIDSGTISGSVVNGNAASAGKAVTITGNSLTLKSAYSNYSLAYDNTQTVVISKRPLTVSATPTARTYDGTRVIALTNPTLSGWVSSDTLLKTYAAAIDSGTISGSVVNGNAASAGKTVTITGNSLTLKSAYSNYSLAYDNTQTVVISKRPLTVSATPTVRTYDGTRVIALTNPTLSGWVSSDTLLKTYAAAIDSGTISGSVVNGNAASAGKAVTITGNSLTLKSAYSNYSLAYDNTQTVVISKRPLTVSATPTVRTYDGTRVIALTNPTLSGWVSSDTLLKTYAAAIDSGTISGSVVNGNAASAGKTVTITGNSLTLKSAYSNYSLAYDNTQTVVISKRPLTVSATPTVRTYDGTRVIALTNPTLSGWVSSDTLLKTYAAAIDSGTISGSVVNGNAASAGKAVTITGNSLTLKSAYSNYSLAYDNTQTVVISKRPLTVSATPTARTYDGTRVIALTNPTLSGWVSSDTLLKTYAAAIDSGTISGSVVNGNAASAGKTVTITGNSLTLKSAYSNYSLAYDNTQTVVISKRPLTVSATPTVRTYDGTRVIALTNPTLSGWVSSDTLLKTYAAAIDSGTISGSVVNGNAASAGKAVTITGNSLTLKSAYSNYSLAYDNTQTVVISKRPLTVSATPTVRTYDGTRVIALTNPTLSGWVSSDTLLKTYAAAIDSGTISGSVVNGNAASAGKTVTITGNSLTLKSAYSNYSLAYDNTQTVVISKRPLTVSATPTVRTYDGTRVIALTNPTLSGWVSSDTLLKTYAAAIDSGTISGSVVNGNAASAGKAVTITGNSLTLKSAYSNYSLAYDNTQTVVISKRPLTVSATPTVRTYDGTRVIALTNPTLSGWVSSDTLPKTYAAAIDSGTISGSVVNGNAASAGKAVTITGNSLTLKSAYSNYSLAYDNTQTVVISKRPLTVSATPTVRTYDGTRVIALTNPTLSGWVSSDTLPKTYAAAIDSGTISGSVVNGNAASAGKAVTITGNSLTLKSAYSNYSLAYDNTQTVVISKRPLTVSATPTARTYDGTRVIALTNPTLSGWVSSDSLIKTYAGAIQSGSISGSVTDGNAATANKAVAITGNSLTLKSAYSNYTLTYDTTKTVKISKRPLTVSATPTNRVYDGTKVIALTGATILDNWVSSDSLTKTYAGAIQSGSISGSVTDGNAATANKAVAITGNLALQSAYSNYTLVYDDTKTVKISKRPLTVSATPTNRVYDGTKVIALTGATILDNWVSGDSLTKTYAGAIQSGSISGSVADENVADAKAVTITGDLALKSAYSNYTLVYDDTKTVNITPVILQLEPDELAVRDRQYAENNKNAPVDIKTGEDGYSGTVVSGETVTLTIADGAFVYDGDDGDQVGSGKPIIIGDPSKLTLSSQNYKLQYNNADLSSGVISGLTGTILQATASSGGAAGGGGGGAAIAIVGVGVGVAVLASGVGSGAAAGAAAAGAGAAGAAGAGGASGGLAAPIGSIDTLFNTGIYAHLNGIDMQALYQPKTPMPSVFNTQQATYKSQIHHTYDMALLANNIKAQKAVPLYELDEHLYETIKEIFVQQSTVTNKTARMDTNNNAPA